MVKISPSILTADFLELKGVIRELEDAGVEMLHIDVMDGAFVPNISIGFPVIESLARHTELPLDVHLMIQRPQLYIEQFAKHAERITIHCESDCNVAETLKQIRDCGVKPAISVKPKTPVSEIFKYLDMIDMVLIMSVEPGFGGQSYIPDATDKIAELRRECDRRGLNNMDIQVDGGINLNTAAIAAAAGANILVAGSAIINADDIKQAVSKIRAVTN